jgi:hypothetical protein
MFSWTPALDGAPARGRFRFATEGDHDRFALNALTIPGVSLAT